MCGAGVNLHYVCTYMHYMEIMQDRLQKTELIPQ